MPSVSRNRAITTAGVLLSALLPRAQDQIKGKFESVEDNLALSTAIDDCVHLTSTEDVLAAGRRFQARLREYPFAYKKNPFGIDMGRNNFQARYGTSSSALSSLQRMHSYKRDELERTVVTLGLITLGDVGTIDTVLRKQTDTHRAAFPRVRHNAFVLLAHTNIPELNPNLRRAVHRILQSEFYHPQHGGSARRVGIEVGALLQASVDAHETRTTSMFLVARKLERLREHLFLGDFDGRPSVVDQIVQSDLSMAMQRAEDRKAITRDNQEKLLDEFGLKNRAAEVRREILEGMKLSLGARLPVISHEIIERLQRY